MKANLVVSKLILNCARNVRLPFGLLGQAIAQRRDKTGKSGPFECTFDPSQSTDVFVAFLQGKPLTDSVCLRLKLQTAPLSER